MVMGLFSIAMLINACIGLNLLNKLMRKGNTNVVIIENLIESVEDDQSIANEQHNERLPSILK